MRFSPILIMCILHLCDTTIIIYFRRAGFHYMTKQEKENTGHHPLSVFKLRSRQILCDIILTSLQFVGTYGPYSRTPKPTVTTSKLKSVTKLIDLNYQRSTVSDLFLQYQTLDFRIHSLRSSIKMLPCINSPDLLWYVTYGLQDKFMYLLESSTIVTQNPHLRMTAIIEPSPILVSNEEYEELSNRFMAEVRTNRDTMETICKIGVYDHTRLCSSIFKAVLINKYDQRDLKTLNYVRIGRRCKKKTITIDRINEKSLPISLRVLPCMVGENTPLTRLIAPQFYVVGNIQEEGSVFVFFPGDRIHNELKLGGRVRRVGALLNPFKEAM